MPEKKLRRLWTDADKEWIRANAAKYIVREMSEHFGVNIHALWQQMYKMAEKAKKRERRLWTDADYAYLAEQYPEGDVKALAAHFGIGYNRLLRLASDRGLKRTRAAKAKHRAELFAEKEKAEMLAAMPPPVPVMVPFERSATLRDDLQALQGQKLLVSGKEMRVQKVEYVFGKYRVFTDLQTFVKDDAQFERFLSEIKIEKQPIT